MNEETVESLTKAGGALLTLRGRRCTWIADRVIELVLEATGDEPLPEWQAGAHLDLHLPSGLIRSYSLCGDPNDRATYTMAVLRETNGRGGSEEVHESQLVGRTVQARGPRNHFGLDPDRSHHILLAGGIGITPIKAMAQELQRRQCSWELHYGGRSEDAMAYRNELIGLAPDRVVVVPEDTAGMLDLGGILGAAPAGSVVYCCGPPGMIAAASDVAAGYDLDFRREQFTSVGAADGVAQPDSTSSGFRVQLKRTGVVVDVPADRSILEVVKEVCPDVESSCEEGFCGTCEARVIEGVPEHRDTVLTDEERASNEVMMICVGRSRTPLLVLDL